MTQRPRFLRMCCCLLWVGGMLSGGVIGQETNEDGFEALFDGSNLDHFRGYQDEAIGKGWQIEGDSLMFDGNGWGDIVTRETYKSFDLRFDWKVTKAANSGVMYRVTLGDSEAYFSGPEYQILDDDHHDNGKNELTTAGSLYGMYPPRNQKRNAIGEWNTGRIVLRGNRIEHWLNGIQVVSTELGSHEWIQKKDSSKFKTYEKYGAAAEGHIAFQDHGDKVWFRRIRIKRLDD